MTKMTKIEKSVRDCMVFNVSQALWLVVDKYNCAAKKDPLFMNSKAGRRQWANIIRAAKSVAESVNRPCMSDSALEFYGGKEAVRRRHAQVSKAGNGKVISFRSAI